MLALFDATPHERCQHIGERARALRVARGLTQRELADRAGVALGTLRVFERSGRISLPRLLAIAHVLGALAGFDGLFPPVEARTLAELEALQARRARRYGRRRRPAPPGSTEDDRGAVAAVGRRRP